MTEQNIDIDEEGAYKMQQIDDDAGRKFEEQKKRNGEMEDILLESEEDMLEQMDKVAQDVFQHGDVVENRVGIIFIVFNRYVM